MEPGIQNKKDFDVKEIINQFINNNMDGSSGAILIFVGIARKEGIKGKRVRKLLIEAYKDVAADMIKRIVNDVKVKYDLNDALILHAYGEFEAGEPLVIVALSKRHRDNIYKAMDELINRYKTEPPLFKKEMYEDGSGEWIT